LLTRKLSALQNGKTRLDGFVRGSDFFRELAPPFSNHCDMLYLNASLVPGPHLRTVLLHEYTHAVTFSAHALTPYLGRPGNEDEESWLNEGLAHLCESLHEGGWTNLEHRISAYLAEPEKYALVVPNYFAAGIWRNPGSRGAAFLFLRSVQSHADEDFPRRLAQSPYHGIANLEIAAQKPFAELFRQASIDCLGPANYGYLDPEHKGPLLAGPRCREVRMDQRETDCTLTGAAAAYFLVCSRTGGYIHVTVNAGGPVQVTLVRKLNLAK
jgi:hypothetical protein